MTVLLPPASEQRKAYIERQIRRRWRLSLAAATVISALIGALASYFIGRAQRVDTRADVERLERQLSQQTTIIRNLETGAAKTATEFRSLTDAVNRLQVAVPTAGGRDVGVKSVADGALSATPATTSDGRNNEPPTSGGPPVTREEQGFGISLVDCRRIGGLVTCELTVANRDRERYLQIFGNGGASRAVDLRGNEFYADRATLGSKTGDSPYVDIPTDVVIRASLRFSNIPETVTSLAILQLSLGAPGTSFKIEFRRVGITN